MWKLFMNFFSRVTTSRTPQLRLSIAAPLWEELLEKLRERGGGMRESGAFLLGEGAGLQRVVKRFVLYDDLDPECLDEGYVRFDGRHYGRLWEICAAQSQSVVGDVHTHPFGPAQSHSDMTHPMVSIPGHIALIVPNYARAPVKATDVGLYVYLGRYRWAAYRGRAAARVLNIESEGQAL
jgi:proteasome lid subunit RPN8/RPN11